MYFFIKNKKWLIYIIYLFLFFYFFYHHYYYYYFFTNDPNLHSIIICGIFYWHTIAGSNKQTSNIFFKYLEFGVDYFKILQSNINIVKTNLLVNAPDVYSKKQSAFLLDCFPTFFKMYFYHWKKNFFIVQIKNLFIK